MSPLSARVCQLLSHVMSLLAAVMDGCDLCYQNALLKGHLAMIQEHEHIQKLIIISWISSHLILKIHATCMKSVQG